VRNEEIELQTKRIDSAFIFLTDQVQNGEVAKAHSFFTKIIQTESQLALEKRKQVTNVLNTVETSSE